MNLDDPYEYRIDITAWPIAHAFGYIMMQDLLHIIMEYVR